MPAPVPGDIAFTFESQTNELDSRLQRLSAVKIVCGHRKYSFPHLVRTHKNGPNIQCNSRLICFNAVQ